MKIAFDEHVPTALVRVLKGFASERRFKRVMQNVEIEEARDYAPKPNDPDYIKGSDVPWIRRFAEAGGYVVISGDTDMMWEPHERLALVEEKMIVLFFGSRWSNWEFFRKCALLLHWWPVIAAKVNSKRTKRGSFWRIPSSWPDNGKLQSVSTEDKQLTRIKKQLAAQPAIAAQRKAQRGSTNSNQKAFDFGKQP